MEAADYSYIQKYNLTLILVLSKNICSLNSSVCENLKVLLCGYQVYSSLGCADCVPKNAFPQYTKNWLTEHSCHGGGNTKLACIILVCQTECVMAGMLFLPVEFLSLLQRALGGCGGCLWAVCSHLHSFPHHSHTANMQKKGMFPYRCFCITCSRNSRLVGSPSFCPCAHLPAHNTKHRVFTPGFRAQLASACLVSPGSHEELVLACIPLVMASTLEPESAFATEHHNIFVFYASMYYCGGETLFPTGSLV